MQARVLLSEQRPPAYATRRARALSVCYTSIWNLALAPCNFVHILDRFWSIGILDFIVFGWTCQLNMSVLQNSNFNSSLKHPYMLRLFKPLIHTHATMPPAPSSERQMLQFRLFQSYQPQFCYLDFSDRPSRHPLPHR